MLYIDGDIIVYKAAAASTCWKWGMRLFSKKAHAVSAMPDGSLQALIARKVEPSLECVYRRIDSKIKSIQDGVTLQVYDTHIAQIAACYAVFLSPEDPTENFRYGLAKRQPYKGNRQDVVRPFYFKEARQYLIDKYKAIVAKGHEADDELGIRQCDDTLPTVICSTDKDLKTIPGWNYNWDKKALTFITPWDAEYNFYMQMLVGDHCDNIRGIDGIGPMGAAKALYGCNTTAEMLEVVIAVCMRQHDITEKAALEYIDEIGSLLRIRRTPNEIWNHTDAVNIRIPTVYPTGAGEVVYA